MIKMFHLRSSCIIHLCLQPMVETNAATSWLSLVEDFSHSFMQIIFFSSSSFSGDTVKIGAITYKLKTPQNPELVPVKHSMWFFPPLCTKIYLHEVIGRVSTDLRWITKTLFCSKVSESLTQTVAHHLRWIMQKDLLGQDVFLIGPPGPLRRSLAMQYLVSKHKTHTFTHDIWSC